MTLAAESSAGVDLTAASLDRAFVGGRWLTADSGADIAVTDPATGERIGSVPRMGRAETLAAIEAAHIAWGPWRALTAGDRSAVLRRWAGLVYLYQDRLAELLTAEQGKPLAESRAEIGASAGFLTWFAEEGRRAYGRTIPTDRPDRRLSVIRQPVGVVAAITPWNFPSSMITRKAGPALAAGCTMVVKPSEETPLSALALARLAEAAGVPAGVFNIVTGSAREIGGALTGSELVRKLTFTGSTAVGKLLAEQSAATVKRVSLELGGNAPFIVCDDADLDAAVAGAIGSKFRNAGQACVATNRIYVQDGIYDRFVDAFTARVRDLVIGNGTTTGTQVGPMINADAAAAMSVLLDDAVGAGARIAGGGVPHPLGAAFFEPTVLVDVADDMECCRSETFGPIAPVMCFRDDTEVIRRANATAYGLVAYCYTTEYRRLNRFAEELEFGMVGMNDFSVSTEVAPFGGVKESGIGREGSQDGLDEYTEVKYICTGGMS
ncbi:NAD-dependent succinate-semialdehyde dehydrogenase [Nocardia flavorosea]|uniref:NAD-dependent succinate-semialdehyde dehydrogenase n=1 Tax=Nocardia flavorosea TaxID=53429 RepID=UPI000ACBB4CF|nr:NAD-dependent succinate-semialdehyde dehydrogenase [Nocardia flavorosea]